MPSRPCSSDSRYYVVPVYDYALVTEPLTPSRSASRLAGTGAKDSAMPAGNSITRAPQPTVASCGADTMQSIIGTMALVPVSKTIMLPLHDWRNTSSRHFPSWKGFASPTPGAERSIPAHALVRFGGRRIMERRPTPWDIRVLAWVLRASGRACSSIFWMAVKPNGRRWKWCGPRPLPFPPEPLRSIGIRLSRWSMAQADANQGRENLWLRAMNWLGLGFDS